MPTDYASPLEWLDRVRAAVAAKTPLRLRGGGSKDFYGEAPQGELLDTRTWCGITDYAPTELVITARCGTPLAELEAALAEKGQCLAFEPPHFAGGATLGGMVAAGLSGPARASVGPLRDYVLGLRLINGRAEHLRFGGQVMKNVAGYDLSRLMVGALGTLGLITEVSLKVMPRAPLQATLMARGIGQQASLDLLNRWGGQPLPLNASCWVHDAGQDCLFVRLSGAAAAVHAATPRMLAELQGLGAQALLMDNAQAAPDWQACRDQTLPFFTPPSAAPELCLWRLSLPQTAPALDLPYAQLIEWHGGLRWLWAPLSAQEPLRQLSAELGGNATLFIANDAYSTGASSPFCAVFQPLDPVQAQIHQRLKAEFDPSGIFNPGRLYPHL